RARSRRRARTRRSPRYGRRRTLPTWPATLMLRAKRWCAVNSAWPKPREGSFALSVARHWRPSGSVPSAVRSWARASSSAQTAARGKPRDSGFSPSTTLSDPLSRGAAMDGPLGQAAAGTDETARLDARVALETNGFLAQPRHAEGAVPAALPHRRQLVLFAVFQLPHLGTAEQRSDDDAQSGQDEEPPVRKGRTQMEGSGEGGKKQGRNRHGITPGVSSEPLP